MTSRGFHSARSLDDALATLAAHAPAVRPVAGGTDLVIALRRGGNGPSELLLDISRIEPLRGITESNGTIRVGPLATHTEIAASPLLDRRAPLLARAASLVGSPQVRNRGTAGGNLMNAAGCADLVPPLVALGARVRLRSMSGERWLDLADLFDRPYVTRARADELLVDIEFPRPPAGSRGAFLKLGRRNALSITRLSVAALLDLDGAGRIREARLVPGAVFPTWRRVTGAEALLAGEPPSDRLFREAGRVTADLMTAETGRRWSTPYKEPVLAVLVRRALEACVAPRPEAAAAGGGR